MSVCYDCLCLMALFRALMSLARDWVVPRIYPPCVVDRLGGYLMEIKVPGLGLVLSEDKNNSARRYVQNSAGGLFRGKDFAHADWLPGLCGRFGKLL